MRELHALWQPPGMAGINSGWWLRHFASATVSICCVQQVSALFHVLAKDVLS